MTIYCLHLFQGVLAIFFGTTGAESTWNFKKELLMVFAVGWWVPIGSDHPISDISDH
jgi:hypothetical protein